MYITLHIWTAQIRYLVPILVKTVSDLPSKNKLSRQYVNWLRRLGLQEHLKNQVLKGLAPVEATSSYWVWPEKGGH